MILYRIKYYENEENLICIFVDKQLRKKAKYVGIENMYCKEDEEKDDEEEKSFCGQDSQNNNNEEEDDEDEELQSLKSELLHIHGMEELLSIRRHRIIFIKGDIFKRENIVHDILMVLLQRFDSKEGVAKEIKLPMIINKKGEVVKRRKTKKKIKLNSVTLYSGKKKKKVRK
ncbi:MAG: hypothetical protein QGG63_00150 [Candidatus Pacebacteria bacterium]|jgi:hypothetical protein|nr:hypothetical protein [Candidatus Paceibacterota bacterium]|tara:strand:- start:58135 stop:58650 length:516 start_codon:yes stop_codon:yes gene_type:complete